LKLIKTWKACGQITSPFRLLEIFQLSPLFKKLIIFSGYFAISTQAFHHAKPLRLKYENISAIAKLKAIDIIVGSHQAFPLKKVCHTAYKHAAIKAGADNGLLCF